MLDSAANDAALAARSVGDAGAEDEDDGSGSPRGTANSGAASTGLSYTGLSPLLNEATLDGLSEQQSFRAGPRGAAAGGPRSLSSYSGGAVQSFRVLTQSFSLGSFSAEYGGAGGARVVTTRAGGDQFHGSAKLLTRESVFAATNPYSVATSYRDGVVTSAAVKPTGAMNQLGVSLGLPLAWRGMPANWRRRVTLFGSVETQLHDDKIVSSPASASFFSLTPEQVALLGNRGVSAAAANTSLDYLSSLTGTTTRNAWRVAESLRLDVGLSARNQLSLGYAGNHLDVPAGAALGQASDAVVARGAGSLGDSFIGVDAVSVRWLHTFSPRGSNEVRTQAAHDLEYETPRGSLAQEPAIGPGGYAPEVSIGPEGFAYGTPANLGRIAYPDELRYEVADTLRLQLKQHMFSVGGDWSRIHDRIASLTAAEGAFLYDSGNANGHDGGLVDWITDYTFNVNAYPNGGCPSINAAVHDFCFRTYTQGFGANATEFVTHEFAGFMQDAWHARKDLLLSLGVRYDYTLVPLPQQPNEVLDADLAAAGVTAATSRFPEDRNNFGPRLALAWSPKWARMVTVDAGYGVYFGRVPGATVRAALTDTGMASSAEHIRITPTTEALCPQVTSVNQGFGYPCAYTSAPPAAVAQTTSTMLFAPNFRAPLVQRGTLLVEREFPHRLNVRVGYSMALAKQLPASVDLNIAPSPGYVSYVLQGGDGHPGLHKGEVFIVPLYAQRRVLQYGPVTEIESNANAYYSAGNLEMQWRGARGLALRGSYTFSRAIDDGAQQSATPSLSSQFDPLHNGYDKGLSSLQFPQRFAGDLQYEPHVLRGPEPLRRALNGWRMAAIATAGSGSPYSYTVFGGSRLPGGHETINGSGGATYLPTVGRNTLRLPPRGKVDLRVGREFAAGARVRIEAFAEAFNLLNTRNISSVETRAFLLGSTATIGGTTSPAAQPLVFQDAAAIASEGLTTQPFGTPTSSTTGVSRERQVEFGVTARF